MNLRRIQTEIANKVAKIPFVKKILKPIYYPFKAWQIKQRNAKFKKNALAVIEEFDKVMTNSKIPYVLAAGSMLGAVREKGFLKHDLDIDTFIWNIDFSENINNVLSKAGFVRIHYFVAENGKLGREETYKKNGVTIDIFYLYEPINKYPYNCAFSPCEGAVTWHQSMKKFGKVIATRFESPIDKEIVRVPFETLMLPIPKNANDWLAGRYGINYMIPDPNFKDINNPCVVRWEDIDAQYIEG